MHFAVIAVSLLVYSQLLCIKCKQVPPMADVDTARCGVDVGCYFEPLKCIYELDTCAYVLTWHVQNVSVRFDLTAKLSHRELWAAVGLNDKSKMAGASVVDCIVNVSDHNRVIIQMSYNHKHHNHVLTERFAGLVTGSMSGAYNGSHIMCSYSRLIKVDAHLEESARMMNLSDPRYVLLARGATNGIDVKAEHAATPIISHDRILLLKHSHWNPLCSTMRPEMIRMHVSLMVLTWMIFSSIGITIARYMKPMLTDFLVRRKHKQLWFQLHRICMTFTLLLTVAGVIIMFAFLHWEVKPHKIHVLLGFITTGLVILNPIIALLRPVPTSPRRFIFRWIHGVVGHGCHLLAVVTMYFGVEEPRAEMPAWAKWSVLCFGVWRILADVLLTSADYCTGIKRHEYILLRTDPSLVHKIDKRYITNFNKVLQLFVMSAYLIGAVALAGSIIVAVNMDIC